MTLPDHYRHSYGVLSEKLVDAYKYLDDMLAIVVDELKANNLYETNNLCLLLRSWGKLTFI